MIFHSRLFSNIAHVLAFLMAAMSGGWAGTASGAERSGEALFQEHCSACHAGGGNIVNPKKTLMKKDMSANKIKTADDIVRTMRNPGPGMLKFDAKTVSDKEAKAIAEYVLKAFNK